MSESARGEYYSGVNELKKAKLFQGLSDSELRSIEKQMKIVNHPAGHEIVVRGDGGVGFMVITAGTVTVKTVQGKSRKLGPGDSFGEMALLDHAGRSATVTADTDVTLATIPEWKRVNSQSSRARYSTLFDQTVRNPSRRKARLAQSVRNPAA